MDSTSDEKCARKSFEETVDEVPRRALSIPVSLAALSPNELAKIGRKATLKTDLLIMPALMIITVQYPPWKDQSTGYISLQRDGPLGCCFGCDRRCPRLRRFALMSVFLGFVEAAAFPGALYYLSTFYTRKQYAFRVALLSSGAQLGNGFGGLFAVAILKADGQHGIEGWRWLFIVEGVTTVGLALILMFILPNSIATVTGGNEIIKDELGGWKAFKMAAADPKTYLLMGTLYMTYVTSTVTSFFPSVVSTLGYSRNITYVLTTPPYLLCVVIMIINGIHSDQTQERYWHIVVPLVFTTIANIIAISTLNTAARYVSMMMMPGSVYSATVVILSWVAGSLTQPAVKRAAALGLINAVCSTPFIWSPYLYSNPPRYVDAFTVNLVASVLAIMFATATMLYLKRQNARLDKELDLRPSAPTLSNRPIAFHIPPRQQRCPTLFYATRSFMDAFYPTVIPNEDVRAQIEVTEANIRHLTSQIRELEQARQKERRTLGQLRLRIAPVGKLPVELLVETFALAVRSNSAKAAAIVDPINQVFLLSQVCSLWRQIVIGSPKLWAEGVVNVRLNRSQYPDNYLDGLGTILGRSMPLPISLSLAYDRAIAVPDAGGQAAATTSVLRALSPTASRWKSLRLDLLSCDRLSRTDYSVRFTNLEVLNLVIGRNTPIHIFSRCPNLRLLTLKVEGGRLLHDNDVSQIPLAQLTVLYLEDPSPSNCRSILLQCTNVVSATFLTSEWDNSDIHAPPTVLPCLRTLVIKFPHSIHNTQNMEPFFTSVNPSFAANSRTCGQPPPGPGLACRRIRRLPTTSQELIALLRLTPALTKLSLSLCERCVDGDFFKALTYGETHDQQLVPHLQQLYFRKNRGDFPDGSFMVAIRSRCLMNQRAPSNATPLQRVTVVQTVPSATAYALKRSMADLSLELSIS
ncbi:Retrograde regulation protein 2 [Mycena venus]|uniref:Retrograde regulation protein 2 n=1 Tax=Mycena venus TaxID=2733690 RepID=A0A8H6YFP2_9AGAR|nr:Retrograde regulation protein 2 [Mycena venus]